MSFPQVLTGVAHIGIPTNDLAKTIAFYKKLGFVSALETVNKAAGERVAFLQLGDLMIETYGNPRAAEKAGAIDPVALATTDIEAAFAAAKEAGMHLLHSSIQSPVSYTHLDLYKRQPHSRAARCTAVRSSGF